MMSKKTSASPNSIRLRNLRATWRSQTWVQRLTVALTAAIIVVGLASLSRSAVEAASWCSCVDYVDKWVNSKFGIDLKPIPSGYAKDMGAVLDDPDSSGRPYFVKTSTAGDMVGAVVVFQPGFNTGTPKYKNGVRCDTCYVVDGTAGHVGVILSASSLTCPGTTTSCIKVKMRSANFGGSTTDPLGLCNNVNDREMIFKWTTPYVAFWARNDGDNGNSSRQVGDEVQAYWANLVGDDQEDALVYNPVAGGYAIWDFSTDTQARSGGWSPGWTHVVLGNFTGDTHTDAIVYNKSKGAGDEISAVLIDFNPPGGTYQQVRTYSWSPGWTDIVGGDFVGDTWDELVFYNSAAGRAVVWNPRTDSLIISKSWSAGWTHVVRGNFAGDLHTDVLVYNSAKETNNVVVTDFAANQQTFVGSWSTGWTHIVPGDMVGDGHADVLAYSTNRATAALVNFTGSPSIPYSLGTGFTNVVTGDLLGDSKHEALLYSATTGRVIVFNFSSGTKAVDRTWSTGWAQTLTGNFVGDSKRDLFVYNPNTGVAAIVSFSPSYDQPWSRTWSKGWIVYS